MPYIMVGEQDRVMNDVSALHLAKRFCRGVKISLRYSTPYKYPGCSITHCNLDESITTAEQRQNVLYDS